MFTSYDKAITALIMSILSIISLWLGWGNVETLAEQVNNAVNTAPNLPEAIKPMVEAAENLLPPVVTTVLSIAAPFLVWLVPNKR